MSVALRCVVTNRNGLFQGRGGAVARVPFLVR